MFCLFENWIKIQRIKEFPSGLVVKVLALSLLWHAMVWELLHAEGLAKKSLKSLGCPITDELHQK